jgi:hypothetical protein
VAFRFAYFGVAYNRLLNSINFVERRFPRVTKSFVDKIFKKLVKKCFGINFFKLAYSCKKSMACLNITKR